MDWVYYLLLIVVMIAGLLLNIVGLPGLWLIVAAYGGYAALTGWNAFVGWPSLIAIVVLALVAEVVEFVAGAAGSKAAGGRTRGMIGAVVGGFLGAIFLSIIPIPIVAQIFGACLGAFLGAMIMEMTDKDLSHSLRVGAGAAKGRFVGILSKLAFGILMMLVAVCAGIPIGTKPSNASASVPPSAMIPAASTLPTTEVSSLEKPSAETEIAGSWRSENVGLDFPTMIETFSADGTVTTTVWRHKPDEAPRTDGKPPLKANWRIQDNAVEIGTLNKAGTFIREGLPRPIMRDASGQIVSVGGSKREPAPTSNQ